MTFLLAFRPFFAFLTEKPRWIARLIFLGFGVVFTRLLVLSIRQVEVMDDAYMFSRYAYNVAKHGEYTWNIGERSYGCTSVFNTLFLAIAYFLNVDLYLSDKTILLLNSYFWAMLALFLVYKISFLATKGSGFEGENTATTLAKRQLSNLFLTSITVLTTLDLWQFNIANGMDTTLGMFGNLLLIYVFLSYQQNPSRFHLFLGVFAAYLTFAMRPDNGIYAVLFPVLFLYAIEAKTSRIVAFCVGLSLFFVVDSLLKYCYFGYVLPLPFYIKNADFYAAYLGAWQPQRYLEPFLGALLPAILAAGLFLSRSNVKKVLAFAIPTALTLAYFTTVIQIMGGNSRYYMPSLPFILVGSLVASNHVAKKTSVHNLFLVAAFMVGFHLTIRVITTYDLRRYERAVAQAEQYPALQFGHHFKQEYSEWQEALQVFTNLVKKLPLNVTVAASEYGRAAACNKETRIMDLAGLHNEDIAFGKDLTESLARYAPELLWMPQPCDTKRYYLLCSSPYFQENYDFYPNCLLYGLAIRKNSRFKPVIIETLKHEIPALWGELIPQKTD